MRSSAAIIASKRCWESCTPGAAGASVVSAGPLPAVLPTERSGRKYPAAEGGSTPRPLPAAAPAPRASAAGGEGPGRRARPARIRSGVPAGLDEGEPAGDERRVGQRGGGRRVGAGAVVVAERRGLVD